MPHKINGNTVSRLRGERGISQDELSACTGISQQHISRIENGDLAPRITTVIRLADALGVSIDRLLDRKSPEAGYGGAQVPYYGEVPVPAGDWGFVGGGLRVLQPEALRSAPRAFAVRLLEDWHALKRGDAVLIDPDRDWEPGATHLVRNTGDERVELVELGPNGPSRLWQNLGLAICVQPSPRMLAFV